jgi:hypothetical protein
MEKGNRELKEDSLLSNLSNISYGVEPKLYEGGDFFRESAFMGNVHKQFEN